MGKKILEMVPPGRWKRGRPKRFVDAMKEDMSVVGETEDTKDTVRRRLMICCGNT